MDSFRLVNIGFGNALKVSRILAVVNPGSSPIRKLKDDARVEKKLIDVTEGRRTRAIIILDSGHLVLSSVQPDTINQRLTALNEEQKIQHQFLTGIKTVTLMSSGTLFVLSAPSGCGKTTMVREVMRQLPDLVFSISHTTRQPRKKEQDGVNYHFVSLDAFAELRDQNPSGFLEWAEVHGNFYGTSKYEVELQQAAGQDVILDIDVQGAGQVMAKASPVSIFISPPSMQELERRLRGRGTEDDATIRLRMENAQKEMEAAARYDYLIINDVLEEAINCLKSIIIAERCRYQNNTVTVEVDG